MAARLAWLDALRGGTILLVILHHSVLATAAWLRSDGSDLHWSIYKVDEVLSLVRMPLFFLCSGVLFASAMQRGWSWFIRHRLIWAIWVIWLWSLMSLIVMKSGVNLYPWWDVDPHWLDLFWNPIGNMWFVFAVALVGATALIIGRLPKAAIVFVALILSSMAWILVERFTFPYGWELLIWNLAARGLFFFLLGMVISDTIKTGFTPSFPGVLAALVIWAIAYYPISQGLGGHALYRLALSIPATFAALVVLRYIIDGLNGLASWLGLAGGRSLDLFLLHQFGIGLIFFALASSALSPRWWIGLPILFLGSVGVSVLASWVLRRAPGNFFFATPHAVSPPAGDRGRGRQDRGG